MAESDSFTSEGIKNAPFPQFNFVVKMLSPFFFFVLWGSEKRSNMYFVFEKSG